MIILISTFLIYMNVNILEKINKVTPVYEIIFFFRKKLFYYSFKIPSHSEKGMSRFPIFFIFNSAFSIVFFCCI